MYRVTKVYYGIILLYKTDYELLRCFKGIHTQIEEYTYLLTIRKIIYTFLYYENTTNIPVMSFSCLEKLLVFSFSGKFLRYTYIIVGEIDSTYNHLQHLNVSRGEYFNENPE